MSKHKLVPVEPTEAMIDAARDIHEGEKYLPIILYTDIYKAMLAAAPAVQGEPVGFCEDAALSIAERTFSTDVDEQLASDIIQYAQRLHSLYAAPQPAEQQPDVTQLVEALVACARASSAAEVGLIVDTALAAHRKGDQP